MLEMRAIRVMWLVASLVAGGNLTARAASLEAIAEQNADHGFDVANAFTLRLQLPFTQRVFWQRIVNGGYNLNHGGAISRSSAARYRDATTTSSKPRPGPPWSSIRAASDPIQRCGWAYRLACRPPAPGGSRWNVRIPVLASGHIVSLSRNGCDAPKTSGRVFDMASGIDATRWSPDRQGFQPAAAGGLRIRRPHRGDAGAGDGLLANAYTTAMVDCANWGTEFNLCLHQHPHCARDARVTSRASRWMLCGRAAAGERTLARSRASRSRRVRVG